MIVIPAHANSKGRRVDERGRVRKEEMKEKMYCLVNMTDYTDSQMYDGHKRRANYMPYEEGKS